jgi:phosphoglycolate phosphatase
LKKKLVLFDIDGTILRVDGTSRTALIKALLEVYGTDGVAKKHNFGGKMDGQIIHEVLELGGLSREAIVAGFEAAKSRYLDYAKQGLTKDKIRLMPGVQVLIERLAAMPEVQLGLLTGNFEEGARYKLEPHDLWKYFPFGAFGSDAERRIDLPVIAIRKAKDVLGQTYHGEDLVVIGDTEHDVACGKLLDGSTAIAVATGHVKPAELARHEPHYLFSDLSETEKVIAAILGVAKSD